MKQMSLGSNNTNLALKLIIVLKFRKQLSIKFKNIETCNE
jgi:hypothetical protein